MHAQAPKKFISLQRIVRGFWLVPFLFSSTAALSATNDQGLRMEVIAAPNLVVDSNKPLTGPSAAHFGVKIFNDGTQPLTNVRVSIGTLAEASTSTGTPAVFPQREVTESTYAGIFNFTMPGGPADAVRTIPSIAPGKWAVQYFFVTYPRVDDLNRSVVGGSKPDDDLWLEYDVWASATEGAATRRVNKRNRGTMRSMISASANKIWPNNTSKVPDKYLSVIESELGWRPDTEAPKAGSTATMEGIWYDLGNVGQGFDNDGDGIPDRNIWMQPVGDPSRFSPLAARLVKSYGLVIVKLNDGTEKLIPFEDQLYFTNIPENNRGAVGLVFYEFLPLTGGGLAQLSPYQEVASGRDNEKYNGDYGNIVGSFAATAPSLTFTKTGSTGAAPGNTVPYVISATNTGTTSIGDTSLGLPVVIEDAIPANTTYVQNSAAATAVPAGNAVAITWSTDNGASWSATQPASGVTRIRWTLANPLAPGQTFTVGFSATLATDYSATTLVNTATLSLGGTGSLATATTTTTTGSISIGDRVWLDANGNGLQEGGETGISGVTVRLYRDNNNNGVIDAGDTLLGLPVTTGANGSYSFNFLQPGNYLVTATTPAGHTPTTPTVLRFESLNAFTDLADFGFIAQAPASIGQLVYFDKNGNGSYQPETDIPLPNVTVNLYDGAGVFLANTSTNAAGQYLFSNLIPGTYTVSVDLGDTDIPAFLSAAVASHSNFTLSPGQNDTSRNFRFVDPGNITKEVNQSHLNNPGDLTFTIRPSYTGPALTNAVVTDTLPAGTTFVSVGQGGMGNPVVTWQLGSNTSPTDGSGQVSAVPVTFVQSATNNGSSNSGTLTLGAVPAQGDLMLLSLSIGSTATPTIPAGWNLVRSSLVPAVNPTYRVATFWKAAGAGEAQGLTFSFVDAVRWSAGLSVFRHVDITNPIHASSESINGVSSSVLALSVTTSISNAHLVGVFGFDRGNTLTASGMTARASVTTNAGPNGTGLLMADQAWPSAGSTGDRTASASNQSAISCGQLIALRPRVPTAFSITTALSTNNRRLVTGGTRITVTLTATATGNAGIVTPPANLTLSNATSGVTATRFSGPTPLSAEITGTNGGSATFTYEYDLAAGTLPNSLPGSIRFQGAPTSANATWGTATSSSVLVTPPLSLTVNVPNLAQGTVINKATLTHNGGVLLGESAPTLTTLGKSIGDLVWADADGNQSSAGEAGIAGVRVFVDPNGNGVFDAGEPHAITNHLGAYRISGLASGVYVVRLDPATIPTGFVATTAVSRTVDLTVALENNDADFGLRPPGTGSIGDFVWRDTNGNGLPDAGEEGIGAVLISLFRIVSGNDVLVATTTTSSTGNYLFNNLHVGDYRVVVNPLQAAVPNDPFGNKLRPTTSMTRMISLSPGQAVLTADFGFAQGATIGDTVFYDLNGNGTQDYNELGISGVTVQLFQDNGSGQPTGPLLATAVTDSSGSYQFTGLLPGTYYVLVGSQPALAGMVLTALPDLDGEPVPAGYTGPAADSRIVVTYGSNYTGADFGYQPPGAIGDFVWLDLNKNGKPDPGEPGIADVVLQLTKAGDPSAAFTVTTDFDGYWGASVSDGTWTLSVLASNFGTGGPLQFLQASTWESVAFTVSGGAVTVAGFPDVENFDLDFGFSLNGSHSISGTVLTNDTRILGIADDIDDFFDDGEDMDAGPLDETELPGIVVYLYNDTTGDYLGFTVTDENGRYSFTNLPTGNYRVIIGNTSPFLENSTLTTTVANNPATTAVAVSPAGTSVIQVVQVTGHVTAVDFAFIPDLEYDYGDLPLSYGMTTLTQNGARHVITPGLHLGAVPPDADRNGMPSSRADGDDRTGVDDEDGVVPLNVTAWIDGDNGGTLRVTVVGEGWLVGWIDWNNDRDFLDQGDMVINQAIGSNMGPVTVDLPIDIPAGTITGSAQSWLSRFRLFPSQPPFAVASYTGTATGGEVEDHLIEKPVGGSIGSFVWRDLDGDGVFDANETGLGGIQVRLSQAGQPDRFRTTSDGTQDVDGDGVIDPPGYYRFTNLAAGAYTVTVMTPPAFHAASTTEMRNIALGESEQWLTANFGYTPFKRNVSGTVFFDTNNDGQFGGDTPAVGVKIQLWNGDVQVGETLTGSDGSYVFPDVPTGSYSIITINPPGQTSILDVDGGDAGRIEAVVTNSDITGRDFLISSPPLHTIGGSVYHVSTLPGNRPLAGIVVTLYSDRDNDGLVTPGDTALAIAATGLDGSYAFGNLPAGRYVVRLTNPSDSTVNVSDAQGPLDDGQIGINLAGSVSGQNFLINGYQKCADQWDAWTAYWISEGVTSMGPTANPDGDRYNNLLEYAFCLPPDSGAGKPFCLVPSVTVTGKLDGVFSRTAGGPQDITYVLQHTAALGMTTTWTNLALTIPSGSVTVTNNGDGTETVRIIDIEAFTDRTGSGFVRIRADLDNGTITASAAADTMGWVETGLDGCQTYNNPFLRCSNFTGTVASVAGDVLTMTSGVLPSGETSLPAGNFHIEITSGAYEGHRFDVVSANGNEITLTQRPGMFPTGAPFNTWAGALPDLTGAEVILRRHWTIAETFPPAGFHAAETHGEADQVQIHRNGTWTSYWLSNAGAPARWVPVVGEMTDAGGTVLPPGQGMFFNRRSGPVGLLAYGEVRENNYLHPLDSGLTLAGGGYPIDQSAAGDYLPNEFESGVGGRELKPSMGFFGSLDFKTADSFFVWKGDTTVGATSYDNYWLANGTSNAHITFPRWLVTGDNTASDRGFLPLFKRNRSVFLRTKNPVPGYTISAPWTP